MIKLKGLKFILISLTFFVLSMFISPYVIVAEEEFQTLGDLSIGDIVVDKSWEWHYRLGFNYSINESYPGTTKPVEWIVIAKNHYSGMGSHVTLLSKELVGMHKFDDSSDRGNSYGLNDWSQSGTTTAEFGIRPFLNSLPKDKGYSYAEEGFYSAFSETFKYCLLTTPLPGRSWDNLSQTTNDRVFCLSQTEMGGGSEASYIVGRIMPYFDLNDIEEIKELRKTEVPGFSEAYTVGGETTEIFYWTRSARANDEYYVRTVYQDGNFHNYPPEYSYGGLRPSVNLYGETKVSKTVNDDGAYELLGDGSCHEDRRGDVNRDGLVNVGDAIMILRYVVGLIDLSEEEKHFACLTGDGVINVTDAIIILRMVVGLA